MSEEELLKEFEALKVKLENMSIKRTRSEKFTFISAIITPILVVLIGGYITLTQTWKQVETTAEVATQDRWIQQAKLASELMGDFLNADELRARMALELVTHADASLGSRLYKIIVEVSQDTSLRDAAITRRDKLRERLIRQLIHESKSIRWDAAEALLTYSDDPSLIDRLIAFAKEDSNAVSESGSKKWRIYNVMTVILDLARDQKQIVFDNRQKLSNIVTWSIQYDPRTKKMADELTNILKK